MAAERYLSRRIPDLRVGNNIDEIDKKLIPASIHPWYAAPFWSPYSKPQINQVEKVQRTAARWTCRRLPNTGAVKNVFLRTIPQWNSFSPSVVNSQTTEEFRALLN